MRQLGLQRSEGDRIVGLALVILSSAHSDNPGLKSWLQGHHLSQQLDQLWERLGRVKHIRPAVPTGTALELARMRQDESTVSLGLELGAGLDLTSPPEEGPGLSV